MTTSPNQFRQSTDVGYLDLQTGLNNVLSCVHKNGESVALVPGQAVKIVDSATPIPAVEATDADTEIPFGFVVRNLKDEDVPADATLEVARVGTIMFMKAGAAIARGAAVAYDLATNKVITRATTDAQVGIALDKAAADNAIIRVIIEPAAAPLTLDGLSDVTLTSPSNTEVLKFNGTIWVNAADAT